MPIELRVMSPVVPKPRPRLGRNGCYLPGGYTSWESSAVLELLSQRNGIKGLPIDYGIALDIKFGGHCRGDLDNLIKSVCDVLFGGHCRGDLDNLIKSVCDVLVKAQILRDDSLSIVRGINATWEKTRHPYCIIRINKVH